MDGSFEVRRGHSASVLICLIEHGTSGTEDHHLRVKGKRLVSAVSSLLLIQPIRECVIMAESTAVQHSMHLIGS